jgi:hypothetical protein
MRGTMINLRNKSSIKRAARILSVGIALLPLTPSAASRALPSGRAVASLKYRLNEKLVSVPVRINASRIFWFVVDTGARHTVIDSAVARQLHLPIVSSDSMTGAGKGSVEMLHAKDLDISIGAASLHVADPWIIDLNAPPSRGKREDGLIGADFFAKYVVRIDPEKQTIAFYPKENFRYRGDGARLPLDFLDNRMFVNMRLALTTGISANRHVRVDTGSNDAVSDNIVRQSPERLKSLQGVGLGTPYVDYSGVIDRVQIGPYAIHHSWGASNDNPAVGMEILRRFTMTFDVGRDALYLEPNSHFSEPVPAPARSVR